MVWSAGKILAAASVYGLSVYSAYVWQRGKLAQEAGEKLSGGINDVQEADRVRLFGVLAPKYDAKIEQDEASSGIKKLRKDLLQEAEGDVLEVACGTGRNTELYAPSRLHSLTLTDASAEMLEVARSKYEEVEEASLVVEYQTADAQHLPFDDGQFDCVVDTFGLCSFEQPQLALIEICRVLKPGGKALLLEHGSSDRWWVRGYQAVLADSHLRSWGCFWNRPIAELVEDSPLIIDRQESTSLGTVTLIVAHAPNPKDSFQVPRIVAAPVAALTPIL